MTVCGTVLRNEGKFTRAESIGNIWALASILSTKEFEKEFEIA